MNSLRGRLTLTLLLVTAAVGVAAAAAVYLDARQEIDEMFDYELRAVAESIDPRELARRPAGTVGRVPDDDVVVQVWSASGALRYRSDRAQPVPAPGQVGFEALRASTPGAPTWRSYGVDVGGDRVQVAQSMATRRDLALEDTLRLLAPGLLMLPVLGVLIGWVVQRSLRPVRALGEALAQRTQGSSDPVPSATLPVELLPLVNGFNTVLDRMARAMATQRAVVADAAHELRTPLAAVRLQAQHLQRLQQPDERAVAHDALVSGLDRMTRLVAQLLTLARLEPGASPADAAPVRLDTTAREVLAELIPMAHERGVELSLDLEGRPRLRGEVAGLRALVGNLVDNALRYTPSGGAVVVTVSELADAVRLVVCDNGPGLPAAQRALVLQRFYRVPGSPGDGSGLGLAIAAAVVERQGGSMALSDAAGGGLRVEVCLPIASAGSERGLNRSGT